MEMMDKAEPAALSTKCKYTADTMLLDVIRVVAPNLHRIRDQILIIGVPAKTALSEELELFSETTAFFRSLGARVVVVYSEEDTSGLFEVDDYLEPIPRERISVVVAKDARIRQALESSLIKHCAIAGRRTKPRIASGNFYESRPLGVVQGVDLKAKGAIHSVNRSELRSIATTENIVLISTIGYSSTGDAYVVSLVELMQKIGDAVGASRRLFVAPKIRSNVNPFYASRRSAADCQNDSGAYPTVSDAIEIVTVDGESGLMSVLLAGNSPLQVLGGSSRLLVRSAEERDVAAVLELIEPYVRDGTMVRKEMRHLLSNLDQYLVVEERGSLVGCASIVVFQDQKTAELGSFSVAESARGNGVGDFILTSVINAAREKGLASIFALTTRTEQWFRRRGFTEVDPDWLPSDRLSRYDWSRRSKVFCRMICGQWDPEVSAVTPRAKRR
jgi:amino-acid N-acetyltransferase